MPNFGYLGGCGPARRLCGEQRPAVTAGLLRWGNILCRCTLGRCVGGCTRAHSWRSGTAHGATPVTHWQRHRPIRSPSPFARAQTAAVATRAQSCPTSTSTTGTPAQRCRCGRPCIADHTAPTPLPAANRRRLSPRPPSNQHHQHQHHHCRLPVALQRRRGRPGDAHTTPRRTRRQPTSPSRRCTRWARPSGRWCDIASWKISCASAATTRCSLWAAVWPRWAPSSTSTASTGSRA